MSIADSSSCAQSVRSRTAWASKKCAASDAYRTSRGHVGSVGTPSTVAVSSIIGASPSPSFPAPAGSASPHHPVGVGGSASPHHPVGVGVVSAEITSPSPSSRRAVVAIAETSDAHASSRHVRSHRPSPPVFECRRFHTAAAPRTPQRHAMATSARRGAPCGTGSTASPADRSTTRSVLGPAHQHQHQHQQYSQRHGSGRRR